MRERLDKLLVTRGLAATRQQAQRLIMAGKVVVGETMMDKPGAPVPEEVPIRLKGEDFPWVSRGGVKLAHALTHWELEPAGKVCLDVGASTGGFTDVLLQHGASRVYAVDVGHGQLAWKLVQDSRVINLERLNIRHLGPEQVPEPIDFLVMDVSFISVRLALPPSLALLKAGGEGVVLIKPQFEVGKGQVGKGGVVRDEAQRREVVAAMCDWLPTQGVVVRGVIPSPILGPKGNEEFLVAFYFPSRLHHASSQSPG